MPCNHPAIYSYSFLPYDFFLFLEWFLDDDDDDDDDF